MKNNYINGIFSEIPGPYYEMSSFPETKVEKYINRSKAKFFLRYPFTKKALSLEGSSEKCEESNLDESLRTGVRYWPVAKKTNKKHSNLIHTCCYQ